MPNDPETVKLLQKMLEELQKTNEGREQTARVLSEHCSDQYFSEEGHERRMKEIKKEGEQRHGRCGLPDSSDSNS